MDGYTPTLFFDCGDYVAKLCTNAGLLARFEEQLERTIPYKRHTDYYYTMNKGKIKINSPVQQSQIQVLTPMPLKNIRLRGTKRLISSLIYINSL